MEEKLDPDSLLRRLFGYKKPSRNDCRYPHRFNHEDTSRMHGWGIEGEGPCDYPQGCEMMERNECPFYDVKERIRK